MKIRKATIKSVFLTGLLVLVPFAITLWVLSLIIGTMDQTLLLLPGKWQPENLIGFRLPGLGAVLTVAFVFLVGLLTQNIAGRKLFEWWTAMVRRIPVIGPLYGSIQQVSDTLLSGNDNAFRKALLIEYPRKGAYTVAFLTGTPGTGVAEHLPGEHVSVYVPTTPNPTSGFFLLVPKDEVVELDMSIEAALKYIVSMGVVPPVASGPLHVLPLVPAAIPQPENRSNPRAQ